MDERTADTQLTQSWSIMADTSDNPGAPTAGDRGGPRWALIAGAIVIVIALLAALFLLNDDDGDDAPTSDSTTSTETTAVTETTSVADTTELSTTGVPATEVPDTAAPATTGPATTQPATTDPGPTEVPSLPDALRTAIWPWAATDTRYDAPVRAATSFATDFLGFDDPIVGEFTAGDSRSGEIELRTFANGPVTVVFVRQLTADDTWWILGAASENIIIDEPATGDEVTSPLTVSGSASAFEGTVDVELRADGNGEPIFNGFVTGSGAPEPGPYSETFAFTSPGASGGALVMLSRSPEDGSVLEASALRIFYR